MVIGKYDTRYRDQWFAWAAADSFDRRTHCGKAAVEALGAVPQ